jgi:hypothetical protein
MRARRRVLTTVTLALFAIGVAAWSLRPLGAPSATVFSSEAVLDRTGDPAASDTSEIAPQLEGSAIATARRLGSSSTSQAPLASSGDSRSIVARATRTIHILVQDRSGAPIGLRGARVARNRIVRRADRVLRCRAEAFAQFMVGRATRQRANAKMCSGPVSPENSASCDV